MMSYSIPFKLHYWPTLTFGTFIVTFIISYFLAVTNRHVYPIFPYISDTGTYFPESCIFAQLFNIAAIFMGITLYIRYQQIKHYINMGYTKQVHKWNKAGLILAGFIVAGISIVGNFQEMGMPGVHFFGAALIFISSPSYFLVQTRITFSTLYYPEVKYGISKSVLYFRLALMLTFYPMLLVMFICGSTSFRMFRGKDYFWWTPQEDGFYIRLVSTILEWVYVTLLLIYVCTFTDEFKTIQFEKILFTGCESNVTEDKDDK